MFLSKKIKLNIGIIIVKEITSKPVTTKIPIKIKKKKFFLSSKKYI